MAKKRRKKRVVVETRKFVSMDGKFVIARTDYSHESFVKFLSWCGEMGVFIPQKPSKDQIFRLMEDWFKPAFSQAGTIAQVCDVILMAKTFGYHFDGAEMRILISKLRKLLGSMKERETVIHWAKEFLVKATEEEAALIIPFIESELGYHLVISKICTRADREALRA